VLCVGTPAVAAGDDRAWDRDEVSSPTANDIKPEERGTLPSLGLWYAAADKEVLSVRHPGQVVESFDARHR